MTFGFGTTKSFRILKELCHEGRIEQERKQDSIQNEMTIASDRIIANRFVFSIGKKDFFQCDTLIVPSSPKRFFIMK